MANRVSNLRFIATYKQILKLNVIMPQCRCISQSATPSQSSIIQMSHLNPEIISKIEKQIAAQGNQFTADSRNFGNSF